ncbi:hypothetical protein COO91_08523 [Nostoc flagelliforme CCNUN1]|uniref:Uncharacterized protein n=1 Tax=Nostoc flagelliforme CCNUN1 TaxID=2038116 RepID=A0A2K8T5U0_9NOSO|nr:hypothetical protein COO91_08523 [Nostoc flagelliforme CCNUN1]
MFLTDRQAKILGLKLYSQLSPLQDLRNWHTAIALNST